LLKIFIPGNREDPGMRSSAGVGNRQGTANRQRRFGSRSQFDHGAASRTETATSGLETRRGQSARSAGGGRREA